MFLPYIQNGARLGQWLGSVAEHYARAHHGAHLKYTLCFLAAYVRKNKVRNKHFLKKKITHSKGHFVPSSHKEAVCHRPQMTTCQKHTFLAFVSETQGCECISPHFDSRHWPNGAA